MKKEELTGYASKDQPWLKYYNDIEENKINLPNMSMYEFAKDANKNNGNLYNLNSTNIKQTTVTSEYIQTQYIDAKFETEQRGAQDCPCSDTDRPIPIWIQEFEIQKFYLPNLPV